MENEIKTVKEGVITIQQNGDIVGIIYNDIKTRAKRLYWVKEMSVEEIAELVEHRLSTTTVSSTIDK